MRCRRTYVLNNKIFCFSGCFTKDEAETYIQTGSLNGMFVLGRSIGFIGKLIKQIFKSNAFFFCFI